MVSFIVTGFAHDASELRLGSTVPNRSSIRSGDGHLGRFRRTGHPTTNILKICKEKFQTCLCFTAEKGRGEEDKKGLEKMHNREELKGE